MNDRLKALLFDVDGTLADTERDGHRVAFNRAFREHGLDWEWGVSLYGELLAVSGGKERLRRFIKRRKPGFRAPGGIDRFVTELHASKTRHYTELVGGGAIPLRAGVERLLREARSAGIRLGVVTTTTPANVAALLGSTLGEGAIGWFDVIAAGDVVPQKKPAPDIYRYALDALRLGPRVCLAIEDSDNGLHAATGADIPTLVTVNGYTRGQDFSAAKLVVDQLGEPGKPFRVIAGDPGGSTFVDLALARRLLAPVRP